MNILIVDDEPLELEQLSFLVAKKFPDWNIYTAEDASEAKLLLRETNFSLALVDIQLPGELGLKFCEFLQSNNNQIEVVLITAHQDFQYAKQAIKLHVMDYLVKPVIEKEFYDMLADFMDKHAWVDTKSTLVNSVLQIIREHYQEKLQLADVASQVYVSPTYLSKKFAEETGEKFTGYITRFRIKKAKQLMQENPHWSLFEVAQRVGFSSQHHFSNSFKKVEGITPSQLKEKLHD
ncbi:response regulator [Priestia flexa]|uniref:response regulator transcription factor n=1 Tax=Priestia flexa TaxID=86664 RepID=UPI0020411D51|nr:response regulator [Priestia flexa]MCM3068266.1 response regulator [Priestia flexa]